MKRIIILLALVSMVVGLPGCGACRNMFGKKSRPVATPVYSQYAPASAPTCAPGCNSCGSGGQVDYGYGNTPATLTMPQTYQSVPAQSAPMMAPAGSGTYGQ